MGFDLLSALLIQFIAELLVIVGPKSLPKQGWRGFHVVTQKRMKVQVMEGEAVEN